MYIMDRIRTCDLPDPQEREKEFLEQSERIVEKSGGIGCALATALPWSDREHDLSSI